MTKLSKYFTLQEMMESATAHDRKIDNTPGVAAIKALTALCENVLDSIREEFGVVIITSGFRSKKLNAAVNGASTSQHITGHAADFICGEDLLDVAYWIEASDLDFCQMILEDWDEETKKARWIHISYDPARNQREVMHMIRGKSGFVYLPGLPS